jgi:hypothetical protein
MNQGDKITIRYGERLCNTCKHNETTFDDPPCNKCGVVNVLYEPKGETK